MQDTRHNPSKRFRPETLMVLHGFMFLWTGGLLAAMIFFTYISGNMNNSLFLMMFSAVFIAIFVYIVRAYRSEINRNHIPKYMITDKRTILVRFRKRVQVIWIAHEHVSGIDYVLNRNGSVDVIFQPYRDSFIPALGFDTALIMGWLAMPRLKFGLYGLRDGDGVFRMLNSLIDRAQGKAPAQTRHPI